MKKIFCRVSLAVLIILALGACGATDNTPVVQVASFSEVLIDSVWDGDPEFGINTLIADCMRQRGYEVVVQERQDDRGRVSGPALADEEYVASYGYGVVEQPPEELSGFVASELMSNPFDDAYQALEPSQRAGFSFALVGSENPQDLDGGGCMGQVAETLQDPAVGYFDAVDLLNEYVDRLNADTRVAEARSDWARCMSEAGFDGYTDSTEVVMDVMDRLNSSEADIAEIHRYELQAAMADFDCAQNTFAAISQVETELAPEFYEEASKLLLADG